MRNKKREKISILLLILLGLTIGFAALATTLKINGSATITKNTWNIYWDNIANQTGVTPTDIDIDDEDENNPDNIVSFTVTFDKPGDYFEFTVDAVNAGTLDAEIVSIAKKYNDTLIPAVEDPNNRVVPAYLKYEVTYADTGEPAVGDKLLKRTDATHFTTRTYKIRVEYDRDAVTNSDINDQDGTVSHTFSLEVQYGQAKPEELEDTCPGPSCVYAFYTNTNGGYPEDDDGYSLYPGGVLPLSIATSGPVSSNTFEGLTSNPNELRIVYDAYMDDYYYYYNSEEECIYRTGDSEYCSLYRHVDIRPRMFIGHILDDNRVIQKQYICILDSNETKCVLMAYYDEDIEDSIYTTDESRKASVLDYFGTYDSTTEVGCHDVDDYYECISNDKKTSIVFNYYAMTVYQNEDGLLLTAGDSYIAGPRFEN